MRVINMQPIRCTAVILFTMLPVGCGDINVHTSTFFEKKSGGTTTCYMTIRNKSLNEVCESLSEKLDAKVLLAEGVDGTQTVSTKIEDDKWNGVLKSLAEELSLRAEFDETDKQYTLHPR